MKTRLCYLSSKKNNQVISLNRVEDTIRFKPCFLLPDIKIRSCQYFSCDFVRSYLSAILSNHCQYYNVDIVAISFRFLMHIE